MIPAGPGQVPGPAASAVGKWPRARATTSGTTSPRRCSTTPGTAAATWYGSPPRPPTQNGDGGTVNFRLHPAFWFGMALRDSESAPAFTHERCAPDTDANVFDGSNPAAPDSIGKHPGTAFVEMQFYYPPGRVPGPAGNGCDATRWCADCLNRAGIEPANFAFVTKNGNSHVRPTRSTRLHLREQRRSPRRRAVLHRGPEPARAVQRLHRQRLRRRHPPADLARHDSRRRVAAPATDLFTSPVIGTRSRRRARRRRCTARHRAGCRPRR